MIKIAETGNTTIIIATGEVAGGTQWTVYPYYVSDPTLLRFTPGQQIKAKELSITGRRDKEDLSGRGMDKDLAKTIAGLFIIVGLDRYKDLGFVVDKIDVDPKGEIAKVLETEYGIKSLEKESQISPEAKE